MAEVEEDIQIFLLDSWIFGGSSVMIFWANVQHGMEGMNYRSLRHVGTVMKRSK